MGNAYKKILTDCNLVSLLKENFNNPLQFVASSRFQKNKGWGLLSFISFRVNQLCFWVRGHQQIRSCEVKSWEKETREHFPNQTAGSCNNNLLCGAWRGLTHSCAKRSSTELVLQGEHTEPKWDLLIRKPLNLSQSNPSCPKRALNLEKLEAEEGQRGIRKNTSLYFSSS